MPPLILASGSPRRRQFLLELGYDFRVVRTDVKEVQEEGEAPDAFAVRLARDKAKAASGGTPGAVVLAADTVVVVGDEALGKPRDEADFRRMLSLLSGRTHEVVSAVAARIVGGEMFTAFCRTRVTMRAISDAETAWYWASREPQDKAGGYAIQGRGGVFITGIEGSPSNVVGLPLQETLQVLEQAGVKPPWLDPRTRA